MTDRHLFTSESVSEGHPDKICDRVSDAVLDACLARDGRARVAVETLVSTNFLLLAGEIGGLSVDPAELEAIARHSVKDIGYDQPGFHWQEMEVMCRVHEQSGDIARGVVGTDPAAEGAGDQGLMFGHACDETDMLMPAAIHWAHQILLSLARARHGGSLCQLGPDAKSQVTLDYRDGRPVGVDAVVISTQHDGNVTLDEVRELVRPHVAHVLPEGWFPPEERFFVNPTGRFVTGGPQSDAGLTGRKIIVDTYGGAAPHGGGAFSGKDPSKVDRSAAYAARYLAKNVVAAGLARRCTLQLSYAIGVAEPISVYLDLHGTGRVETERLAAILRELMDLRPRGIRDHLGLDHPIYARTAAYGHFGRQPDGDGGFSWERTDLVEALRSAFSEAA